MSVVGVPPPHPRRLQRALPKSEITSQRGGEVAGVGGVKARGGEKPDEPRGVLTPEVGHNPPVSGCFTRDLGFFRDGAGEFTGPTWGIYEAHLGNLRDPLGESTRPTWGIYEAQPGIQLPGVGGKPPLVGLC